MNRKTSLALVLAGAFLLQSGFLLITSGYEHDIGFFYNWAMTIAREGPGAFYDIYPDPRGSYPPGGILAQWPAGVLLNALGLGYRTPLANWAIGLVPILCHLGLVWLVNRTANRTMEPALALRLTLLTAFNPAFLYVTALWIQVDMVFILPLCACFLLLEEKRYLPAAILYGAAITLKPQALMAGPVLALCYLAPLFEDWKTGLKNLLGGAAAALGTIGLVSLPFFGKNLAEGIIQRYFNIVETFLYASINGFNFWAALGGNWQQEELLLGPLAWKQWGWLGIGLVTLVVFWLGWLGVRNKRVSPLALAALYMVGVFCFAHRMHERYLLPGIALTLLAAAKTKDKRLAVAGAGLSLLCFVNMAAVMSNVGTADEWLQSETSQLLIRFCGLGVTFLWLWLVWVARSLTLTGEAAPLTRSGCKRELPQKPLAWTRREAAALALLTLGVGAVSFWNLGDTKAPQTLEDTIRDEAQPLTVKVSGQAQTLWVYAGVQDYQGAVLRVWDSQGTLVQEMGIPEAGCFKWLTYPLTGEDEYTVALEHGRFLELAFKDAQGRLLPASGDRENCLLDEQDLVPDKSSYKNNFYFDEIYHGRTGYEQLHGLPIYETTHPPLGKDFISLGILLFGMCGFGWRFSGTLFGVGLVPAFYLLTRRLTGNKRAAFCGAALLGLDFMRFTQSRIATIDTYVVFFITLSGWLMLEYQAKAEQEGVHKALLPMALCGIAFGLGCASKWTGVYAGAGLAVVYFITLWHRAKMRPATLEKEVAFALGGGVVFFVVVPLAIYLASYLPYLASYPDFDAVEWLAAQMGMFRYHSSLIAEHPYQSAWYTWGLDLRPVWYYLAPDMPQGMRGTIAAFYSPAVAWGGLAALGVLGAKGIAHGFDRQSGTVWIFYLAQLLPWVMVSRCTFLYHYWAGSVFALAGLTLCLARLWQRRPVLAQRAAVGLLAGAGVLFLVYYPMLSGLPVAEKWAELLQIFPSWYF